MHYVSRQVAVKGVCVSMVQVIISILRLKIYIVDLTMDTLGIILILIREVSICY